MTSKPRHRSKPVTFLLALCALLAPLAPPVLAAVTSVGFDRAAIQTAAQALPSGDDLRIQALPWAIDGLSQPQSLLLQRFEVFAPGAQIVVHRATGDEIVAPPANVYLRGRLESDLDSRVVISVLATGEIRGLATAADRTWLLGAEPGSPALLVREVERRSELGEVGGEFRCELDDLGPAAFRAGRPGEEDPPEATLNAAAARVETAVPGDAPFVFDHTAVIAIETDQEFLALGPIGGNIADATDYIGDLVAFSSTIYTAQLQTSWAVGYISLWASPDPWAQTSPSCGLIDFGKYWNNNHAAVSRTLTHFLSGKSTNAGIAWVGVLCSGAFSIDAAAVASGCSPPLTGTSNWGGGYGYTSGIDANFNINSPSVLWDIMAFTHEIGHNFNSPHTHCYQNVGGNASSIDNCNAGQCGQSGCYCGTAGLPGPAGAGSGTIMSYCHLLGGGMSNTSLSLGLGHPFGVMPERVPNRMRSHVVSVAGGNPSCLAPMGVIFVNGFGSGNTGAWSATVP
jgi:hypothetical protein